MGFLGQLLSVSIALAVLCFKTRSLLLKPEVLEFNQVERDCCVKTPTESADS